MLSVAGEGEGEVWRQLVNKMGSGKTLPPHMYSGTSE